LKSRNAVFIGVALVVLVLGWGVALLVITPPAQQSLRSLSAFTEHAAQVLRARYPDRQFAVVQDGTAIRSGNTNFGLRELYEELETSHVKPEQIDDRIRSHFAAAFARVAAQGRRRAPGPPPATPPWEQAKRVILPYLVTSQYAQRIPTLVHRPLVPGLEVAYTIGQGEGSVLLLASDDLAKWQLGEPQLYEQAVANLASASRGLKVAAGPERTPNVKGHWAGVMAGDGFDGARILLPDVRRQLAQVLGEPFDFAIPERGFLVAWSRDYGNDRQFRDQVHQQFSHSPPNLAGSPDIFLGTAAGVRAATAPTPPP